MSWKDGREYAAETAFTEAQLLEIRPSHIVRYMSLLAYAVAARGDAAPATSAVSDDGRSSRSMTVPAPRSRSNPAFAGAEIFQYDYLNDDITDFGEIDYSLSGKVPQALRQAIADAAEGKKGAKPILVLINPPYGEASNSQGNAGKTGIATTRISHGMGSLGYASREVFVQFLHRIMAES